MSRLENFIQKKFDEYESAVSQVSLFNRESWSLGQLHTFIGCFYHLRNKFQEQISYIISRSSDKRLRDILWENLAEELGIRSNMLLSHEELYQNFASSAGLDLTSERVNNLYLTEFATNFEKEFMQAVSASWPKPIAILAGYEKLDNTDYTRLLKAMQKAGADLELDLDLTFFKVHIKVEHFEPFTELIQEAFTENQAIFEEALGQILNLQFVNLQQLSDKIACTD